MTILRIKAGSYQFDAQTEDALAPKTCAKFLSLLPYRQQIIHVRWSGEGCWIPLGEFDFGLGYENRPAIPPQARSFFIPAASAKRKFCSLMARSRFPQRSDSSPAIIS